MESKKDVISRAVVRKEIEENNKENKNLVLIRISKRHRDLAKLCATLDKAEDHITWIEGAIEELAHTKHNLQLPNDEVSE